MTRPWDESVRTSRMPGRVKVLFVPRPDWKHSFGGDAVQMNATAQRLRDIGVDVDVERPENADLQAYDVVHLWTSLQLPNELIADVAALAHVRPKAKLVLSPVWAPQHTFRWMSLARAWLFQTHSDLANLTIESAAQDLQRISNRALTFQMGGAEAMGAFAAEPMAIPLRQALATIDMVLPNSWMELQAIHEHIGVVSDFHVVPNAVDAALFLEADASLVPPELRDTPFAMMSARFDARKQQDFVMLAVRDLDIPLVFVGSVADDGVFERFKAIGSRRKAPVMYFPHVDQTALRSLYAAAQVHFLPSIFESPGLSSIEAALLDCSIVVGGLSFEAEYFRSEAYYCDPCDAWSIRQAVQTAASNYARDSQRRQVLRERILRDYTWERAAQETAAAYERVRKR